MSIPKVVIVRTIKGSKYASFIAKEINLAGYRCGIVGIKELAAYLERSGCSPQKTIIHARTAHPDYTYKVLHQLEGQGYKVINSSEATRLTSDKYTSCLYAKDHDISCAETTKVSKAEAVEFIKEKVDKWPKVVVKPFTSQGQGEFCFMYEASNLDQIDEINSIPAKELIVQKYIHHTRLSRVFVIGYKAIQEAVFWDAPDNNWKCSVCLNPNIKLDKNPDQTLLEFAESIAKKFKAEVSFIDIFSTENGYVLGEINTACSLVIHERLSGYNISKQIANYLLRQK